MSKFAFDWGQSLEINESLRQIARDLFDAGHEIHLIPACGETPVDFIYAWWMNCISVPFTGIHRCIVKDGDTNEQVAAMRVNKMRELGCHILYDDNEHNLKAVRDAGFEAVEIKGNNPVPKPPQLGS